MPASKSVTVTVDGKPKIIEPGNYSFYDLVGLLGAPKAIKSLSVNLASRATTINPNDSFSVSDGDVFTSRP